MTDITELAQSLKAAAIDAKELAIIARYSKGRAAAEKFYAMANPNNVIALVEALEKAQQRIIALQQRHEVDPRTHEIIDLKERIDNLESFRTAYMEWGDKTDWMQTDKRFDFLKPWGKHRADALKEYIQHLESRTVTINTPAARDEDYDWDGQTPSEAFNTCRRICALMFRQSLRTAGIKVEAE
ncbi:TPA: hypothetical protein ACTYH4_001307 [Klebsiella variicola]